MMSWYDHYGHGVSGWGWFTMSIGMVLFWALMITAAILLFRALDRAPQQHTHVPVAPPASTTAEHLLAERFARGDIDEEEYRRRLAVLRSSGPPAES